MRIFAAFLNFIIKGAWLMATPHNNARMEILQMFFTPVYLLRVEYIAKNYMEDGSMF